MEEAATAKQPPGPSPRFGGDTGSSKFSWSSSTCTSNYNNKKKKKKRERPMTNSITIDRRRVPGPKQNLSASGAILSHLPSRVSRRLIRSHHVLQKKRSQALAADDKKAATAAEAEIERQGGVAAYQRASMSGQSKGRGGDSSRVLVGWFRDAGICSRQRALVPQQQQQQQPRRPRRLLEIGCLSPFNELSVFFDVKTMIDLNSQYPGILPMDFMDLKIPSSPEEEGYDMISLSLVLNYVPTPAGRGEMLKRTTQFFREQQETAAADDDNDNDFFPSLFLVLPAPCIQNSRYLTEGLLVDIMESLGYSLLEHKTSPKLVYYLWKYVGGKSPSDAIFKKKEVNPGKGRNNFAIVI